MLPEKLSLQYPTIIFKDFKEIENQLKFILEKLSLEYLFDQLSFALKELCTNANKANVKRVFFTLQGKDIQDPLIYKKLMESFRTTLQENSQFYFEETEKRGFFIRIELETQNDIFTLRIINNSSILKHEQSRIDEILKNYPNLSDMSDVFAREIDLSEGAGLGIYSLLMMLKNSGLKGNFFDLRSDKNFTIAEIKIPLKNDDEIEEAEAL